MSSKLGVFYFLCLLSGCGASRSDNESKPAKACIPAANSRELVEDAQAYCADYSHCPSSVGLLSFQDTCGAAMCTAFLIGPDLAITNGHCIPETKRNNPRDQSELMQITFPSSAHQSGETVRVKEVLQYTNVSDESADESGKRPDYAVLKLERKLNRENLKLDPSGVQDLTPLKLVSLTPPPPPNYSIRAKLEIKNCTSIMGSGVQPSYRNANTSVISFSDCELIHGNSGSPMLGADGRVKAIAHAAVEQKFKAMLAEALQVSHLDDLNLATNVACIDIPGFTDRVSNQCRVPIPKVGVPDGSIQVLNDRDEDHLFQNHAETSVNKKILEWQASNSTTLNFEWTLRKRNSQVNEYIPVPACHSINFNPTNPLQISVPVFSIQKGLDSKLRASIRMTSSSYEVESMITVNAGSTLLINTSTDRFEIAPFTACKI